MPQAPFDIRCTSPQISPSRPLPASQSPRLLRPPPSPVVRSHPAQHSAVAAQCRRHSLPPTFDEDAVRHRNRKRACASAPNTAFASRLLTFDLRYAPGSLGPRFFTGIEQRRRLLPYIWLKGEIRVLCLGPHKTFVILNSSTVCKILTLTPVCKI